MRPPRGLRLALLVLCVLALGVVLYRLRPGDPASAPRRPQAAAAAPALPPAPVTRAAPGPTRRPMPATLAAEPQAAGGAFEGRVVSAESGEGVARAELTFASAAGAVSVRSDAQGHFRFAPLAPGDYQLATVTAEGFLPFAPEWGQSPVRLSAVAGQRVGDIVLALTPQLQLLGRVLSPEGRPVAGAQVRLLTGRAAESALHPVADRFVSDSRGEFHFRAPPRALLEARHPDYGAGRAVLGDGGRPAGVVELRLRARAAPADGGADAADLRLAGVVLDAAGQPVSGARVDARSSMRRFPTRYGEELGYQTTSDGEGRFVLEGLREGFYDVAAHSEGRVPARAPDVAAGQAGLRLVLAPGSVLVGRVQDAASGRPLPAFTVVVTQQVGALQREPIAELTVLDPSGRYRVQGLPAGPHMVEVVAKGHAPGEQRVEVPAGARDPVRADFQLEAGARLSGTVVAAGTGRPLAGARVTLENGRGGGALAVQLDASTDAAGAFTLDGLAPGEATLVASHGGHHTRILSGVPVRAAGSSPLRIELTATQPGEEPSVEMVGIGAVLAARGDILVVGEVVPGGGAAEVALAPGDGIHHIDGQPVAGLGGFAGAIQAIRGPEGSFVRLGVQRGAALGAADGGAPPAPVVDVQVPRRRIRR